MQENIEKELNVEDVNEQHQTEQEEEETIERSKPRKNKKQDAPIENARRGRRSSSDEEIIKGIIKEKMTKKNTVSQRGRSKNTLDALAKARAKKAEILQKKKEDNEKEMEELINKVAERKSQKQKQDKQRKRKKAEDERMRAMLLKMLEEDEIDDEDILESEEEEDYSNDEEKREEPIKRPTRQTRSKRIPTQQISHQTHYPHHQILYKKRRDPLSRR